MAVSSEDRWDRYFAQRDKARLTNRPLERWRDLNVEVESDGKHKSRFEHNLTGALNDGRTGSYADALTAPAG
jgi:hypothetical protein